MELFAVCPTDCSGSCLEPPQGLGFCTSQLSTSCCNFYASNICSTSCPENISDTSFNCRKFHNSSACVYYFVSWIWLTVHVSAWYFIYTAGVQCSSLDNPLNGTVSTTTDRFDGSTANYTCDTGFNLQGPASRTCQDNGTWSSQAPTCIIGAHACKLYS